MKKHLKKNINSFKKNMLMLFIALVVGVSVYAQKNPVIEYITCGVYNNDWQLYKSLELADIYFKYSDCSDPANGFYPEYILFKVQNKTANKIQIQWDFNTEYNGIPSKSSSNENHVQVQLEANQAMEGRCRNLAESKLGLFVRLKAQSQQKLTDFNLVDLKEYKLN